MSIVNHETGEVIEPMTEEQARRLTERIRLTAESIANAIDKLADLIDEARTGSAWLVLGYRSWTDYVSQEFAGVLPRLDREPRREFVRELSARGMSTRAIAPVVGVSHEQVRKDATGVNNLTPVPHSPAPAPAPAAVDELPRSIPGDREQSPATSSEAPGRVTGIDDKTYARPERPALTAQDAVTEFPDLAYYVEIGRASDAIRMAADLRRFRERGELPKRLAILRRSIEVDKAERNGTLTDLPIRTSHCPTCRCQETP